MAEKQDVVTNSPDTAVERDVQMEAVEDSPSNAEVQESSTSTSPSDMAWVGAVKKESRKKGFDDGYRKAQEEVRAALTQQEAEASPSSQAKAPVMESPRAQPSPAQVSPQMVQAAAQQAQLQNNFSQIAQRGTVKYPDYAEKMNTYIQLAQEKEAEKDADLSMLMTMAATVGNEDLVYKVATDENFRNDILTSNNKLWGKKLLQSTITPSTTSPHLNNGTGASLKVAAPPISSLPKTSSYGALNKMSSSEKRLRQKQRG